MSIKINNLQAVTPLKSPSLELKNRRAVYIELPKDINALDVNLSAEQQANLEKLDLIYRTMCGILYNFVPTSGHPGGSISCARIVEGLLFNTMAYDLSRPDRKDNDMLSYGAGHKAMGLYAMWALRNEIARVGAPQLLAKKDAWQMRLEDLLGFRKNPTTPTAWFNKYNSKALDGHAGPNVPFVPISTGPSGVATASSFGIGFAALDTYGANAPYIHIIEGEAGFSAGRVLEMMSAAATNRLHNVVLHLDWNQASIDSNKVCRENAVPGDYVQWTPQEIGFANDWNVIVVDDGFDFKKVMAAQQIATSLNNGQPSMIVYRTVKGWRYGIEGMASHGAGHKCCSPEFYNYLSTFEQTFGVQFPRLQGEATSDNLEQNYWDTLLTVRQAIEKHPQLAKALASCLIDSQQRLAQLGRKERQGFQKWTTLEAQNIFNPNVTPEELKKAPKSSTTLRGVLGETLNYLNKKSSGAFVGGAADLYASTSINLMNKGFPEGFYNSQSNPGARLLSMGGICEDGMGAFMTGIAAYGNHVSVASSYAAFIVAFQHVAVRVHCIGQQLKQEFEPEAYNPFVMICGHAGIKTGEDGPTHADPQPLQLLQENFARGTMMTLTPWDPNEVWPLMAAAFKARPAVIAPFVTRPNETIIDRAALGLAPASDAQWGVYPLIKADAKDKNYHGTLVLQGSEVGYAFVTETLPKMRQAGLNMNVYYVASAELFDTLPKDKQEEIFPSKHMQEAMAISGFTPPTFYRWVMSPIGRDFSLHPLKAGHYLGSGKAELVVAQAGLDGKGQFAAISEFAAKFVASQTNTAKKSGGVSMLQL